MVQCEIKYEGGLRTRAKHGPSRDELVTDGPVDNRGKGEAFSPTDLLGVALGTCILTLMGITAQSLGRDLVDSSATVQKSMGASPMRHIARLDLEIRVGGDWNEEDQSKLVSAANGCPVKASLAERVQVNLAFVWVA